MGEIYTPELTAADVATLSDALLQVVQSTALARDAITDRAVRDALNNRVKELQRLRGYLDDLTALPF